MNRGHLFASVQGTEEFLILLIVEAGNVSHQRLHCILAGTDSQGQQKPVERHHVVQLPLFSLSTTDWRIPALRRRKAAILWRTMASPISLPTVGKLMTFLLDFFTRMNVGY